MSLVPQLTQNERNSIQQVHRAIHNNVQHGRLALIRNETIFNSDKLFGFVEAFDAILKDNGIACNDTAWNILKEIAKRYEAGNAGTDGQDAKTRTKWKIRVKQTMYISMQWSLEILTHYEWDTEKFSRDRLAYMYNCATIFPRFADDFIPQANLVRWLKHCAALSTLETSKEDDFAPYGGAFAVKDLYRLQKLKDGKSTLVYGREVTSETAGQLRHEIRRWTENQSGVVVVEGKRLDLTERRPEHWNTFLLKFDENGLLVRRANSDRAATPRINGILSPPTSTLVPVDDPARLRTRSTASAMRFDASSAAGSEAGSEAGIVTGGTAGGVAGDTAGSVAGGTADNTAENTVDSTADIVAKSTAAGATSSAPVRTRNGFDPHDDDDELETGSSDIDSTSSRRAGASASVGTPIAPVVSEPSKPESDDEKLSVRRTAHARRKRVARTFLKVDDDASDGLGSHDQGPRDRPLDDGTSHDKDLDDEGPSDKDSDDMSVHGSVEQRPTRVNGVEQEYPGEEQKSKQELALEHEIWSLEPHSDSRHVSDHQPATEYEVATNHGGKTGASIDNLYGQVDEPHVSARDVFTEGFDGIRSWLSSQDQNDSLFVRGSSSAAGGHRSETPDATQLAQTEVAQRRGDALTGKHEAKDRTSSIETEHAPADNVNASVRPDAGSFPPTAPRESPRALPVRAGLPQPSMVQGAGTKSSTAAKTNTSEATSSSATSGLSSELTSEQSTNSGDVARTVQRLTLSLERSSSRSIPSPSEPSLDSSDFEEAWPGCNARDLSPLLKFDRISHHSPKKLSIISDALAAMQAKKGAEYMYQMPPSVFAPYIPHTSIEEKEGGEVWDGRYRLPYGGLRGHPDENSECSSHSDGMSEGSPDQQHKHFGSRPEECTCDTCEDIAPLLERVRIEASSTGASQSCHARERWFGNAKWALAVEASDVSEPGRQSDHEVVFFDRASFREMAYERLLLEKPIVIKDCQHDRGVYSVETVRKALKDSYGNRMLTMSNALADAPTLVGMEDFLTRFSSNEWSVGSSTPHDSFRAQHPGFLSYDRFRLLHSAVARGTCDSAEASGGGVGCGDVAHFLCVNGGLSFNRVETSGAFSVPCLDPFGGTWIRALRGRRLCAFVLRAKSTTSLRDDSVRNSLEWWPGDEQRLILLEPNDVLILPADVVCAQLAVDACVSFEGSFWDEQEWGRYFAATQWAAANPIHVKTQIPRCATRLALQGLKSIAKDDPQRFASAPLAQDFLENDRSGILKTVMAEKCATGEHATKGDDVQGPDASKMSGSRRMSSSQADIELPAKRMCIR